MPGAPGPSPSVPFAILQPGEFWFNPGPTPGAGVSTNFAAQDSAASIAAAASSVASGLVAVTGTIATAQVLAAQFNHFGTVPSGGVCALPPPANVQYPIAISNYGVSGLSVYPPTVSGIIGNAASGAAFLQATGTTTYYSFFGGNQYGRT